MVLAASEDKRHRGACVASPTMPWVWGTLTLEDREDSGPYHLVWPRDLYHVATAQKAAGDHAAALRQLDFLWRVAEGRRLVVAEHRGRRHACAGTAPSSTRSRCRSCSPGELGRTGGRPTGRTCARRPTTWSPTARGRRRSAGRTRTAGRRTRSRPRSPGLICAADIARAQRRPGAGATYEATADQLAATGRAVDGDRPTAPTTPPTPYYLRLTKDADPNDGSTYEVGDNFPQPGRRAPGRRPELPRPGPVRGQAATTTRPCSTRSRSATRCSGSRPRTGAIWHRFTFDGYGEQRDGGQWDIFDAGAAPDAGPALAAAEPASAASTSCSPAQDATPRLATIAATANDGLMLPEQVWDGRPPTGEPAAPSSARARARRPRSAWTHAQFIRLAWSIDAGEPIERPAIVACRYTGEDC